MTFFPSLLYLKNITMRISWITLATLILFSTVYRESYAFDSHQHGDSTEFDVENILTDQFVIHDPIYEASKKALSEGVRLLTEQVMELQKSGVNTDCSDQILIESRWLLEHTDNWDRLEKNIAKLSESLKILDQSFATEQSPTDGSWGRCYDEWFLKLDATIDALNDLMDQDIPPKYALTFLGKIENYEFLEAYLNRLLVSNIAVNGIDHRDELGAITGALSQMFFKKKMRNFIKGNVNVYTVGDDYIERYRRFLDSWQDPRTGYWGAWYRIHGKVHKTADLSLTFHTISYRKGNVDKWSKIIDHTLASKLNEYPYGWMHNGSYHHHNNYDVVKIFRYGWPHMTGLQRSKVRAELDEMIQWCLRMPMTSDSLFAVDSTFYSNPANYYYYGVSFLDEIGYWNKNRRFWTTREFPEAHDLCRSIKSKLTSLKFNTGSSRSAMNKLNKNCP